MKRTLIFINLLSILTVLLPAAPNTRLSTLMDMLASSYYEDHLQVAFGSFTYEYSGIATPFSRWLEDELTRAAPSSKRVRLFNRAAVFAMDPAFRAQYADFFATNQVDAMLSGKFFKEQDRVRVQFDLTSLRNGNLIGSEEVSFLLKDLPKNIAIVPDKETVDRAQLLSNFISTDVNDPSSQRTILTVSVATDRGAGGVYRDGDSLKIYVYVNQDAYVRLYHIDVSGAATLIWPNSYGGKDGRILANTLLTIPGPHDPFAFKLGAPYGTEFIKVLASTEPFINLEADFQQPSANVRESIARGLEMATKRSSKNAQFAEALANYIITP
ncbi:DUF4384 domain-containing protein [Gracilinema caldarium]|uniref:DUF4384 domain-containing protein n=1 Tax=Gracilinema caldarium TaxID=215591 RepID=UPI0026EFD5A5|nr:DUF4384 domain-containing protein [Gracilinema caldarium]